MKSIYPGRLRQLFCLATFSAVFSTHAYAQNPAGTFVAGAVDNMPMINASMQNRIRFGDIDKDGDVDMIATPITGTSPNVYLNNGSGGFALSLGRISGAPELASIGSSLIDVDNDGDLDLYVAVANSQGQLYSNDGTGYFTLVPSSLPYLNINMQNRIRFGDIDNDGDVDAILQNTIGGSYQVYLNDGSGIFSEVFGRITGTTELAPMGTALVDLDNDGDLDLYVPQSGAAASVWMNNGSGFFTEAASPLPPHAANMQNRFRFGDVDNDGDMDVVLQQAANGVHQVYLNNGSGIFTLAPGRSTATVDMAATGTRIVDIDNDGDMDLYVSASASQGTLSINESRPPVVTAVQNASNNVGVVRDATVSLAFSSGYALVKGSGSILFKVDNGDGNFSNDATFATVPVSSSQVTISDQVAMIKPLSNFTANTQYYLIIPPTAFTDATGKGFVTRVNSILLPGIPDPGSKQNNLSLFKLTDKTVLSFSTGTTLPVHLAYFLGKVVRNSVELTWQSEIEENTDRFVVQYSNNGTAWAPIASVAAQGNSRISQNYSFVHKDRPATEHFYRLETIDRDGKRTLSHVLRFVTAAEQVVKVYPNPTADFINLERTSSGKAAVLIYNQNGQLVMQKNISGVVEQLNTGKLVPGTYQLVIQSGDEKTQLQLIKNK